MAASSQHDPRDEGCVTLVLPAASCYGAAQYMLAGRDEVARLHAVLAKATHPSRAHSCGPSGTGSAAKMQQVVEAALLIASAHHCLCRSACRGEHGAWSMYRQTLPTGNGSTPATPLRQKGRLLGIHYFQRALVLAGLVGAGQLHDTLVS